jgi:hypothetical protein
VRRALPWLVSGCILLPNLAVVIGGGESFPFTSAPMFGHYIGERTPLFQFEFRGVAHNGAATPLDPALAGRAEPLVIRLFFSKFYGSTAERSPFGNHPADTLPKFAERLRRFFAAYHAAIARTGELPPLAAIELHLVRIDRNRVPLERQRLGVYDVTRDSYTHSWKPE